MASDGPVQAKHAAGPWHVVDGKLVKDGGRQPDGFSRSGIINKEGLLALTRDDARKAMRAISHRLADVIIYCGDWSDRITPHTNGRYICAWFLDPPYESFHYLYGAQESSMHDDLETWCIAHGANPKNRIAICGYAGDYTRLHGWDCVPWKAPKSFRLTANKVANANRERIWFSPACLDAHQPELGI
jgi:hypothetical protein